ncbi:uncharacterized protein LOC144020815 isoform X1 [Festucalex cinctus]
MDEMLLKKNEQIEGPPNKMDVAFQLEALVTSHSVETQEQPEVSTTALSSLAQECNVEDLGGEVSEDSDGDSSSSSSPFSSATVFENAADDDGLNQPAPFKTKDTFSFEMDARLLKKKEQIERSSKEIDIQLETLVTSHSVDTQEHPEANGYVHTAPPTTIPSLARECNIGGEDSDSDSSSSSSSFSSATVFENAADDDGLNQPAPFKTKDELLLEELPAVEELTVSLPDDVELMPVGTVSSVIQQLVIIQSLQDSPALNEDSIIFRSDRLALGKVFEVFGPVSRPLYIIRFNSHEDLSCKGLTLGLIVYYAPDMKEYTGYILLQQLKLLKGSDASWKNDQEPPEEALDYSDDEIEQQAKRKLKNTKKQPNTESLAVNSLQPHHVTQRRTGTPFSHRNVNNNQAPFRHSTQPPVHTDVPPGYHARPSFYPPLAPPYLYPPHPPPPLNFPLFPPPSFFSPSYTSPFWPPNSVPFSKLPPPPPPPQ